MLNIEKGIFFFKKYIYATGIVLFNLFYFFPYTIRWLFWEYYPGEGYGVLLVAVYYIFHMVFIISCVSLFQNATKVQSLSSFLLINSVLLVSEVFAFRDFQPFLWLFSILYIFTFIKPYKQISNKRLNFNVIRPIVIIGFWASMFWILIDKWLVLH